jgi:hypothetical protein
MARVRRDSSPGGVSVGKVLAADSCHVRDARFKIQYPVLELELLLVLVPEHVTLCQGFSISSAFWVLRSTRKHSGTNIPGKERVFTFTRDSRHLGRPRLVDIHRERARSARDRLPEPGAVSLSGGLGGYGGHLSCRLCISDSGYERWL